MLRLLKPYEGYDLTVCPLRNINKTIFFDYVALPIELHPAFCRIVGLEPTTHGTPSTSI